MSWVHQARGLYAIVDPAHCGGRDPVDITRAILRGGASVLQLRDKSPGDAARVRLARDVRAECRRAGVPFVLNDRADLALLVEADGLHLGQADLPIQDAREIVGGMPIGLSTHDEEQARSAADAGADLIGFGPIFPTRTKVDADPQVGLSQLEGICRRSGLPVVAIGGIDASSASEVAARGARWVAAISALSCVPSPEEAARELHRMAVEG